ncbi:hypothetical protein [Roseococcus sp. SYP-B2431]|uniref:hypothetical protein n=1 Tax=Roseococcus sp. SYP-B2431 TaxID=2496640 RepID=UPI0013F43823|nr:hypothetical protein [Roseococcus sp. SYP-B2431]
MSSHLHLSRLLLRQLDRHPIRALPEAELASYGEAFADFRQAGMLHYRRPEDDLDLCRTGFGDNGELIVEGITAGGHRWLDIDFSAVGAQARRAAGLAGPPLERLSDRVLHLGQPPGDVHRRAFYLVRLFTNANALDIALALKGRSSGTRPVIVTPVARDLALDVGRRLELEGIPVVAAIGLLDEEAAVPVALRLTEAGIPQERPPDALEIDEHAGAALFHRQPLDLEPRHFRVLVALGREASTDCGIVPADALLEELAKSKDQDRQPQQEQVAVSISRIRAALRTAAGTSADSEGQTVRNDRQGGYALMIEKRRVFVD